MPTFSASQIGGTLAAVIVLAPVVVGGASEPPAYKSATAAYHQGAAAMDSGKTVIAMPALEYAAKHGVLGAELRLARAHATGHGVPKDDAKAFYYYQIIADRYADIPAASPIARYVGEAFCALGRYYVVGIPAMPLHADPAYASGLFRHAGAYFGDANAQYELGRLYLTGKGVEKNRSVAANWLAMAARKQHASAQATLGEMLWRGDGIDRRQARGLALLTLASENAKRSSQPDWILERYRTAFAEADAATRKRAAALAPKLGRSIRSVGVHTPSSPAMINLPSPAAPALSAAAGPRLGPVDTMPPAAMGLSVGFGAADGGAGGIQP